MVDVDEYVNNAMNAESEADSCDNYVGAELNLPNSDGFQCMAE